MSLPAGAVIGKYVVRRKLAEGGMAEIYLCSSRGAQGFAKDVVIKRIRPFLAQDPEFVKMFIAEARIACLLNHANVVQIFDFDQHDDTYYLAMEYVRGRSLWELGAKARELMLPVPSTLVAHIGVEVARGLEHAHRLTEGGQSLGLVHRDISPHNVLLSYDGAVKLTDFGIARAGSRLTAPGMIKGKFAYMSPEQSRGEDVDARTDVFALGVVLWELLTGAALFDGKTDIAVLRAVQEQQVVPPSTFNAAVPPELDAAVMRALERDPRRRFQTAHELERALAACVFRYAEGVDDTDVGGFLRTLFGDPGTEEAGPGTPAPLLLQRPASGSGPSAAAHPRTEVRPAPGARPGTPARGESGRGAAAEPLAPPPWAPDAQQPHAPLAPPPWAPDAQAQAPLAPPPWAPDAQQQAPLAPPAWAPAAQGPLAPPAWAPDAQQPQAPLAPPPWAPEAQVPAASAPRTPTSELPAQPQRPASAAAGQTPRPAAPARHTPPPSSPARHTPPPSSPARHTPPPSRPHAGEPSRPPRPVAARPAAPVQDEEDETPEALPEPPAPPRRSLRGPAIAVGGAVVLLGAVGVVVATRSGGTPASVPAASATRPQPAAGRPLPEPTLEELPVLAERVTVSGGLGEDAVRELLGAHQADLAACPAPADSAGEPVTVQLLVERTGSVTDASVRRLDGARDALTPCVLRVARGWTFPAGPRGTALAFPWTPPRAPAPVAEAKPQPPQRTEPRPVAPDADARPRSGQGRLVLKVTPWAMVSINGKAPEEVNGGRVLKLAPGTYTVKFTHPSGAKKETQVVLKSGRTESLEFSALGMP